MPGEHVVAEVAARPAQHGVRVVRTVLRVVVLDEQVRTLDPVVVAVPRPHRAGPGEVQLAFAQPGGLRGGELGAQPVEVHREEVVEQRAGGGAELRRRYPEGLGPLRRLRPGVADDVVGRGIGDDRLS